MQVCVYLYCANDLLHRISHVFFSQDWRDAMTSLVDLVQPLLAKEIPSSDLGRKEILYLMETRGQIFQAAYYILQPESVSFSFASSGTLARRQTTMLLVHVWALPWFLQQDHTDSSELVRVPLKPPDNFLKCCSDSYFPFIKKNHSSQCL